MTASSVSSRSPPRGVTFSEYSELVLIPRSDEHALTATWYSSQDRNHFRQVLISEARRVSKEIKALSPGEVLSHEQLCECLGVEVFITMGAARKADQARRSHISSVLSEQCRQKQVGECDLERLSRVSKRGSESSTIRASKLAAGYAAIMD
jgi:hypothetical protein